MTFLFNVGFHSYMHTQHIELYFKHVLVAIFFFFWVNNLLYIFLICTFLITFWSTEFYFILFYFIILFFYFILFFSDHFDQLSIDQKNS